MTLTELIPFLISFLPYINSGIVILIIDLILRSQGFEVTTREFKRKPWESLFWGLCLILISNFLYLLIQAWLSQITSAGVFLILIVVYFIIVANMTTRRKK